MTFNQWQQYAQSVRSRADVIQRSIIERARKACRDAGLDPTLLGIHPHNAMVSFDAGKPWPNVDYSKVRLCQRLMVLSWVPSNLADDIISRKFAEVPR